MFPPLALASPKFWTVGGPDAIQDLGCCIAPDPYCGAGVVIREAGFAFLAFAPRYTNPNEVESWEIS